MLYNKMDWNYVVMILSIVCAAHANVLLYYIRWRTWRALAARTRSSTSPSVKQANYLTSLWESTPPLPLTSTHMST